MLKLCIEDDEGQETIVPIIRDEITIGRQEGNTIRLTERNVSRRHARLIRDNGAVYLEPVSARYGVRKNGQKIDDRAEFTADDVFLIGDYRLTLQTDKPAAMAEAPMTDAPQNEFTAAQTEIKPLSTHPRRATEGTEILPAMPAKIVIISSNFAGQEFPLGKREIVIGRSEECDIIIDHRSVSTTHAKIVRESGGSYQIVDLNSKNGIRISGEKYISTYLKRGDLIELGHVKFRFVEPGENYVFTPGSASDDELSAVSGGGKSNLPLFIGGGVVAIILIAVAVVVAMGSGPSDPKDPSPTPPDTNTTITQEDKDPVDTETYESTNPKVKDGIAKAREQLKAGEVTEAIAMLKTLLDFADPSEEDRKVIKSILSDARTEKPHQPKYTAALEALEGKDYSGTLEKLGEIPPHSLFTKLAEDKGVASDAIDGLLGDAEQTKSRSEKSKLIGAVLAYDPDNSRAKALQEQAAAVVDEPKEDTKPRAVKPKRDPPPKKPKLTKEEGKELLESAKKKLLAKGDPGGAISDCKKALSAGTVGCHRILGLAYKTQNKNSKACSSFRKALKYESNVSAIEKIMTQLECD